MQRKFRDRSRGRDNGRRLTRVELIYLAVMAIVLALQLDVRTGKHLWTGDAGQPVAGGVVSYQVDGQQRIAVAAGMKSPIWPVVTTGSRVVVFGLP